VEVILKKTLRGFVPAYPDDEEKIKKFKLGSMVKATIKTARNIKFHKKFFALLNVIYKNQEMFDNLDIMRSYLTIKAGFYDATTTDKGVFVTPKSISFAKMDNIEFEEFYYAIIRVVCSSLIPGLDRADLLNEVDRFLLEGDK
jgi:hypothetical protein